MAPTKFHPLPQCFGKAGFQYRAHAEEAVRRMRRKDKAVNVYHCPHCKNFHIGGKRPNAS